MSIPNFKNEEDWKQFQYIFDGYWSRKLELLNTVKDGLFPGYGWQSLPPSSIETINDITQSLLYDAESTFKEEHPEYKTEDDEIFIPRRTFKEDVTEALLEANQKFWNNANECPPCDVLQCADHLTDE
jgi:hypothetical protein